MSSKLRIVYLGTPDFAVESLDILIRNNYNVVGVITMPDKPAGRGQKLQQSPIKKYALEHNLPLLQPTNLKDPEFVEALREWRADVQVVVAFRMLPEVVWNMPRFGTINVHASLLPHYRGAAPINWSVINGDRETGVSTFRLKHEIDTGGILIQKKVAIDEKDTAGIIHDKLMYLGAEALVETIEGINKNTIVEMDQASLITDEASLKKAPKLFKTDCKIDWEQSVESIYNKIRGLSPYPTAFCELTTEGNSPTLLKLFSVEKIKKEYSLSCGDVIIDVQNNTFDIVCQGGAIRVNELQLAGKKRMNVIDFLRGFKTNKPYRAI